jgi:hypothetical protein
MGYRPQSFASAVATIRPFWPARIGPIATCFVLKGWPMFPFVLEIAYPGLALSQHLRLIRRPHVCFVLPTY